MDAYGKPLSIGRIICGGSSRQMMNGTYDSSFVPKLVDLGINTFDLARVYGSSEKYFGSYLKNVDRDRVVIVTKCCHPLFGIFRRVDRHSALADVQASLTALNVDHVDLLLLHRDDERKDAREIISFMNELVSLGYTRAIGVSNWSVERIKAANDYAKDHHLVPFVVNEPQFSMVRRYRDPWHNGSKSISGEAFENAKEYFCASRMTVFCYSSLADGFLSGKYDSENPLFRKNLSRASRTAYYGKDNLELLKRAQELAKRKKISLPQLSLAYVLSQEFESAAIVNLSSLKRAEENFKALDVELDEEAIHYLKYGNQ